MWDERNLGSVDEEKQRYEAMQYRLKSLLLECQIKKLQEQADFYRWHKKWLARRIENLKHWWVMRKARKVSVKAEA